MSAWNDGAALGALFKRAMAKTLDDISDSTVKNRDESFIAARVHDAPPRDIADNETAIDANATDKTAPAKEILKDTVKGELPSTTPSGPPPHGNLRDEEKSNAIAADVATRAVDDVAPTAPVVSQPAVAEESSALAALKSKMETIIAVKPQIDEVHRLIAALGEACAPHAKTAEASLLPGGQGKSLSDADVPPKQLAKGMKEEAEEHGAPPATAKTIAKDHIVKDKAYYDHLAAMEAAHRDPIQKTAEIDVLTGAPGAGKTTAAKRNADNYDVVLHGDLPLKLTGEQRRIAVVARIRDAMRSHNMGKRVLLDSAPRQLQRDYQPLLTAAKRIIAMDVPEDVSAAGFAKRTKASPEKSARVVASARGSLSDLRNDPRFSAVDRDSVHDALKKIAASAAEKPMRRRAEVLIVDGLNVYCVEKPYSQGGIWFPGGGVDTSDEKFADAAAREAKEETGIVVDEIHRMAHVDPIDCIWDQDANSENPKWAEKAKKWRGDRTYFYVATAHHHGKPTGDDHLKGDWLPLKYVASRLLASVPFDNKGWKPLTKARYKAVLDAMPHTRTAPRAA